jgi:SAM-dependent methyltransferase
MDRRQSILKYATKEQRGIEIGPWFNPIAPKREGYRCSALDVFDTEALRKRPADDPNIPAASVAMMEVGASTHIGDGPSAWEASAFDYVVSCHNFEHLPNPIRFLQGCVEALRPGVMLSMAIPDRHTCFACFRSLVDFPTGYTRRRRQDGRKHGRQARKPLLRFRRRRRLRDP